MYTRKDIINKVFELVSNRLNDQVESLQHYIEHWHGSYGGIEGWLKVEFVAAIPPDELKISTGSAARGSSTGKKYPDLLLKKNNAESVKIELKASTNWHVPLKKYKNRVLFFLCGTPSYSTKSKKNEIKNLEKHSVILKITSGKSCYYDQEIDFLFGYVDLKE